MPFKSLIASLTLSFALNAASWLPTSYGTLHLGDTAKIKGNNLEYTPRESTLQRKTIIRLPEGFLANGAFHVQGTFTLRCPADHFHRDQYLLWSTGYFLRYSVDRRAFEAGIRSLNGVWKEVRTPWGHFNPKKDTAYQLATSFDGSTLKLIVNGNFIASTPTEPPHAFTFLEVGAYGFRQDLNAEGDFLLSNLKLVPEPLTTGETALPNTKSRIQLRQACNFPHRPVLVLPQVNPQDFAPQTDIHQRLRLSSCVSDFTYREQTEPTAKFKATVGMAYDRDNLYLSGTVLQKRAPIAVTELTSKGDNGLERDDAIQLILNIPGAPKNPYQFKVNCRGQRDDSAPRHRFNWNGNWLGSASTKGKAYHITMAIPAKNFGLSHWKPGMRLKANICISQAGENYIGFCWSPVFNKHQIDGDFGTFILGQATAGRTTFHPLTFNNQQFSTSGTCSVPAQIRAFLFSHDQHMGKRENLGGFVITDFDDLGKTAVTQQSLTLSKPGNFHLQLPSVPPGVYWLMTQLTDTKHRPLGTECKVVHMQNDLGFTIRTYPSRQAAGFFIQVFNLPQNCHLKTMKLILNAPNGTRQTYEKPFTATSRNHLIVDHLLSGQTYDVKLAIVDVNGRTRFTRQQCITLPPRPIWADTNAGKAMNHVPKPWFPLILKNQMLSCWGRTYDFTNGILPTQIISQNKKLLAAPMRLVTRDINNNENTKHASSQHPAFNLHPAGLSCSFNGKQQDGNAKLDVMGKLDYDGMLKLHLNVTPQRPLKHVYLDIPLHPNTTTYLQPGPNATNRDFVSLLTSKPLSFDMLTPKCPLPGIWIASDDVGLYVTTDTYGTWTCPPDTMVQILPQADDSRILRLNFYNSKQLLNTPKSWTIFLEACPIKPYPDNYFELGGRICNGFSPMLARTPIEDDTVLNVPFKTSQPTGTFTCSMVLESNKDLTTLQQLEPLPYFQLNDAIARICFDTGKTIKIGYVNKTGYLEINGLDQTASLPIHWKPAEKHLLSISIQNQELTIHLDGLSQKIKLPQLVSRNGTVKLGSITANYNLHSLTVNGQEKLNSPTSLLSQARCQLDYLADKGVKAMIYFENWCHFQAGAQSRWESIIKDAIAAAHQRGIKVILYFGFEISEVPEMTPYLAEHVSDIYAQGRYYPPAKMNTRIASLGSPMRNYYLFHMARLKRELNIDGVYLDGSLALNASNNPAFGCGFTRPDGTLAPTVPVEAIRDFAQRVYNIFIPDGGIVKAHMTFCPLLSGFTTTQFLGEHLGFLNLSWKSMSELIPDVSARAIYAGKNTGISTEICLQLIHPHLAETNPGWYDRASAWFNLYRSSVNNLVPLPKQWPQNQQEFLRKDKLSINGASKATWIPYWEMTPSLVTNQPQLRMSLWQTAPDTFICAIQNNGPMNANGIIWSKNFNPPNAYRATHLLEGSALTLTPQGIPVKLKPYHGILVKLNPLSENATHPTEP